MWGVVRCKSWRKSALTTENTSHLHGFSETPKKKITWNISTYWLKVYCLPIVLNGFLHLLSLAIFHIYTIFKNVYVFFQYSVKLSSVKFPVLRTSKKLLMKFFSFFLNLLRINSFGKNWYLFWSVLFLLLTSYKALQPI